MAHNKIIETLTERIDYLDREIRARNAEAERYTESKKEALSAYNLGQADALTTEASFLRSIRFRLAHLNEG